MSKLIFYDPSIPREEITKLRERRYLDSSPEEKLRHLFALIRLSLRMNGGKPLKVPQGKGIVITRQSPD